VLLGGSGLTGTTDDTVYVPNLNIGSVPAGSPVLNIGLDANGYVVTGNTASSFTGGTVTGDTIFTGGLSACTGGITTNIINACEGNGQLNLRNGGNDIVSLTNDNGTFSDTGIYISPDYGALYSDAYTSVWETSPNFITGYLSNVGIQISNQTGDTLFSKAGIIIGATATGSLTSATVAGGDSGANTLGSIINSSNSTISSGASNTVIIGGNNITGGADNTVYVPYLNINNLGTGTSINNLGIDASGNVVTGTAGGGGIPEATTATTTTINFSGQTIYYDSVTEATGNITADLTGAKLGLVQKIYHNDTLEPTYAGATWVLMGDGIYFTSQLNIIYAEWAAGNRVEYWYVQEQ
jgi:hypothetical protein